MFHFCFMDHVGHFEYYESLRKIAWAVGILMASFIEISTNQYDGIGIFFMAQVISGCKVAAKPFLIGCFSGVLMLLSHRL